MILTPSIYQTIVLLFLGLLLFAALTDIRELKIPNRVSLSVALLYPAYVLSAPHVVDWQLALVFGTVTLVVGFFLFTRGYVGGGDAKLVAAAMLWAAPTLAREFILVTTLSGAVLAIAIWLRHRAPQATVPNLSSLFSGGSLSKKQPMPYAIAIACGGLYVAFTLLGVGLPRLPL